MSGSPPSVERTPRDECLHHIFTATAGQQIGSRTHYQDIGQCLLRYIIAGRGPLIIVQAPGWGIGSPYLEAGLSPLEKDFTMLYMEPRGSRRSTRPQDARQMSTQVMIEDLERLRRYIRRPCLTIMGHSHGGVIGLGYAEKYPERVDKLILVVHGLMGYDDSVEWEKMKAARKDDARYRSAYRAKERESISPPHTDEEYSRLFVEKVAYLFADPEQYVSSFLETVTEDLSIWANTSFEAAQALEPCMTQVEELGKVMARTLVVGATDDPVSSVKVSNLTNLGLKNSEIIILGKCGHFPWIEKREEFFDCVRVFLRN